MVDARFGGLGASPDEIHRVGFIFVRSAKGHVSLSVTV